MKRIVLLLLAGVLLLSAVPVSSFAADPAADGNPFTDIAKSRAKKDVLWAYENGIAAGTGATTFSPSGSLSRGMFVCFPASDRKLFSACTCFLSKTVL